MYVYIKLYPIKDGQLRAAVGVDGAPPDPPRLFVFVCFLLRMVCYVFVYYALLLSLFFVVCSLLFVICVFPGSAASFSLRAPRRAQLPLGLNSREGSILSTLRSIPRASFDIFPHAYELLFSKMKQ